MTLGDIAAEHLQLIVVCLNANCQHQVEPDPAKMAARYGAGTPIPDWHRRLVCSQCGSRAIDFVLTGVRG